MSCPLRLPPTITAPTLLTECQAPTQARDMRHVGTAISPRALRGRAITLGFILQ